jgi:hypothetical protein
MTDNKEAAVPVRHPRVAGPLDRTLIERLEYWKTLDPTAIPAWGPLLLSILIEMAVDLDRAKRTPARVDPVMLEQNFVVQAILNRLNALEEPLGDNVRRVLLNKVKTLELEIKLRGEEIGQLLHTVNELAKQVQSPTTNRRVKSR